MWQIPSFLLLTVLAMALATTVSVAISFYLYRWRRILSADQRFTVPEALISSLNGMAHETRALRNVLERSIKHQETRFELVTQEAKKTQQSVGNSFDAFAKLQQTLDERDSEIRRLRSGYDAEIFRRFIARFVRVRQVVEPTAAALYYSYRQGRHMNGVYAVYDLGGGTFDISVIRVAGNDVEVLATNGIAKLGRGEVVPSSAAEHSAGGGLGALGRMDAAFTP